MATLELNTPKKRKGKTITIIILILLLLGSTSYYIYDKDLNDQEIEKLNKQIEKLDKKLKEKPKEEPKETKENNIVGYYKSGILTRDNKNVDTSGCSIESTYELALYEDGTFAYAYVLGCDGATQSGKYTNTDKEITRVCDDKSSQCPTGTSEKFTINEDGTITNSENKIFYKVDKSLMQIVK